MELAHKYIEGAATESEVAEIKKLLETDAKFRKEFMRLQAMKAMLKADHHVEMKAQMSNMFDTIVSPKLSKQEKKPTKIISLQRAVIAAAAAVALILAATFTFNANEVNTNNLYTAYYSPYSSSTPRGEDTSKAIYQAAVNFYNLGDYQAAQKKLLGFIESIKEEGPENEHYSTAYLLLGNCALNLENIQQAKAYFNEVLTNSKGHQYIQDAKWYLAMTYLKEGNEEEALGQLKEIAETMNVYQIEAQKLLKEWGN